MADIIHEHEAPQTTDSGGMGFLLGVLALIVFMYLLFAYGLPALRGSVGSPTVNVPDKVDVNVNPNTGGQPGTQPGGGGQ